jgi:hypothetical protein
VYVDFTPLYLVGSSGTEIVEIKVRGGRSSNLKLTTGPITKRRLHDRKLLIWVMDRLSRPRLSMCLDDMPTLPLALDDTIKYAVVCSQVWKSL